MTSGRKTAAGRAERTEAPVELRSTPDRLGDLVHGIDATAPLGVQVYERARCSVDRMDFSGWFTDEAFAGPRDLQDPYFRRLGETGHG